MLWHALQIATVCSMMGYRLVDRAFVWSNRPHNDMLLAESEKQVRTHCMVADAVCSISIVHPPVRAGSSTL